MKLLIVTLLGISLVIASACVINNVIDRDIDALMARTKKRALVTGAVSGRNAIIYAVILGIFGFTLLCVGTNLVTVILAAIGFVDYVVLYGVMKRRSVYGTIVGSISGSVAIVVGYCAVTGRFDMGAILLFLILTIWQMPHFYSIAIYRLEDYARANIPVLPVKSGIRNTKIQIVCYIAAFIIATQLLAMFGYTGLIYQIVMLGVGVAWLYRAVKGFKAADDVKWAKQLFGFSLIVLLVFSLLISVNSWLPTIYISG